MEQGTGKKIIILTAMLFVFSELSAIEKIPFRAQWVSVVKKGRLFKYKRKEFSSPKVLGDLVFTGSDAGYFYAMKKRNGRKVWRFKTEGSVNSEPAFGGGPEGSLVYFGDNKGFLYALTVGEGRLVWKAELGSEILTAPAVEEKRLFVATVEGRVVCLNAGDGTIVWEKEHPLKGFEMSIRGNAPPVADPVSGSLVAGFADGILWSLSMSDGRLLWERNLGGRERGFNDLDGRPLVEGDRIFAALYEGGLFSLSRKTGQVVWSRETGSGVRLAGEGEVLYLSGSDGVVHAVRKKDGTEIWKAELGKGGKGALTAPVLYKDLLAVGLSDSTINFLRTVDGKTVARRFARKGISSDPVVDENRIYYLSNGGRLYSLKFVP